MVHVTSVPRRGSNISETSDPEHRGQRDCRGKAVAPQASHRVPISWGSASGQVDTSGARALCVTRLSALQVVARICMRNTSFRGARTHVRVFGVGSRPKSPVRHEKPTPNAGVIFSRYPGPPTVDQRRRMRDPESGGSERTGSADGHVRVLVTS